MKTNNRLLNNFLISKTTDEKSVNTTNSYEKDLIALLSYLKQKKLNIIDNDITNLDAEFFKTITYDDLEEYNNMMYNKGNSPATRSRAITSTKQFFKYLQKKNVITDNPANGLVKPKIPKREPIFLNIGEAESLLNSIGGENEERDYAIITLFLHCGLRLSELVGIDLDHIENNVLHVIGKGNKQRKIFLNKSCLDAIGNYIKVRECFPDNNALFLSERKSRIDTRTVQYIIKKHLEKAGLDTKKYSTHKLRSSSASLLGKAGIPVPVIQKILGHQKIETTMRYVGVDDESMQQAVNANPLNK